MRSSFTIPPQFYRMLEIKVLPHPPKGPWDKVCAGTTLVIFSSKLIKKSKDLRLLAYYARMFCMKIGKTRHLVKAKLIQRLIPAQESGAGVMLCNTHCKTLCRRIELYQACLQWSGSRVQVNGDARLVHDDACDWSRPRQGALSYASPMPYFSTAFKSYFYNQILIN